MKKILTCLILAVIATACCSTRTMDPCYFADIGLGDSINKVIRCAGNPYEVCCGCDGQRRFVFVTRNEVGPYVYQMNRYVLTVDDNGCVVDKCFEQEEYNDPYFHTEFDIMRGDLPQ